MSHDRRQAKGNENKVRVIVTSSANPATFGTHLHIASTRRRVDAMCRWVPNVAGFAELVTITRTLFSFPFAWRRSWDIKILVLINNLS